MKPYDHPAIGPTSFLKAVANDPSLDDYDRAAAGTRLSVRTMGNLPEYADLVASFKIRGVPLLTRIRIAAQIAIHECRTGDRNVLPLNAFRGLKAQGLYPPAKRTRVQRHG